MRLISPATIANNPNKMETVLKGRLKVRPVCAKLNRESNDVSSIDPYCVVTLGLHMERTSIAIGAGKFPCWSEMFVFAVNGEDVLSLAVWDRDSGSTDYLVGDATLQLTKELANGFEDWVELKFLGRDAGQVKIQLALDLVEDNDTNITQSPWEAEAYLQNDESAFEVAIRPPSEMPLSAMMNDANVGLQGEDELQQRQQQAAVGSALGDAQLENDKSIAPEYIQSPNIPATIYPQVASPCEAIHEPPNYVQAMRPQVPFSQPLDYEQRIPASQSICYQPYMGEASSQPAGLSPIHYPSFPSYVPYASQTTPPLLPGYTPYTIAESYAQYSVKHSSIPKPLKDYVPVVFPPSPYSAYSRGPSR